MKKYPMPSEEATINGPYTHDNLKVLFKLLGINLYKDKTALFQPWVDHYRPYSKEPKKKTTIRFADPANYERIPGRKTWVLEDFQVPAHELEKIEEVGQQALWDDAGAIKRLGSYAFMPAYCISAKELVELREEVNSVKAAKPTVTKEVDQNDAAKEAGRVSLLVAVRRSLPTTAVGHLVATVDSTPISVGLCAWCAMG
ncbi:MAG: hypothetical protein SGARI_003134 [Bacillariaceae sp.]